MSVHAHVKSYAPIYHLSIHREPLKAVEDESQKKSHRGGRHHHHDKKGHSKSTGAQSLGFSKSFGEWFDSDGKLVKEALDKQLLNLMSSE